MTVSPEQKICEKISKGLKKYGRQNYAIRFVIFKFRKWLHVLSLIKVTQVDPNLTRLNGLVTKVCQKPVVQIPPVIKLPYEDIMLVYLFRQVSQPIGFN